MQKFNLDLSRKQITLLDQRYYHNDDGQFFPSVTTVLQAYPKGPEYFAWLKKMGGDADAVRDAAGTRGSNVHDLTERYDNGEEVSLISDTGYLKFSTLEWAMFERYVDFTNTCNPEILMNEQTYIGEDVGFAGTIDRVIRIGDRKLLVDIKTSSGVWDEYWLQLAAYRMLLAECAPLGQDWDVDGVAILWLNAKTRTYGSKGQIQGPGWQLITRTEEEQLNDWDLFKATKLLWDAQNKDVKPRNITHQTSYVKA
jgi:hypothetical protein